MLQCLPVSTICLACNAWNEHDNIIQWLESGLAAGCTHVAVLDTGGIDDTLALVRARFPGALTRYTDMNENLSGADRRNAVLELARTSGAEYILWLDADDRLEGRLPGALNEPCYDVVVHLDQYTYTRPHLIRADLSCSWSMPRHEALNVRANETLSGLAVIEGPHRGKQRGGYEADAKVLAEYLAEHPEDRRAAFYLAQSWKDAGEAFKAVDAYKARIRMKGGYWAETAYSWYMLGLLSTSWGEQLVALSNAIEADPARIEPYWQMTHVCRTRGWHNLARMYLSAGVAALSGPPSKGLFVDREAGAGLAAEWHELYADQDCPI